METITVRVPATTANLGPGFDCLGLAIDLWNEVTFQPGAAGMQVTVDGLGSGQLPTDSRNLVARAVQLFYQAMELSKTPPGLRIHCINRIPLGSGLGSSAAATLAGLLGANALLGNPADPQEILRLAAQIEGHSDNAAAALVGGLVLVAHGEDDLLIRKIELPEDSFRNVCLAAAVPQIHLPTRVARAALPREVSLGDAVYNIGRTALVIEALRLGDLDLLGQVMDDRLHQPYRLKLIPGAEMAMRAARQAGADAVALSGAGPSLVAFGRGDLRPAADAMVAAFIEAGLQAKGYVLGVSTQGSYVQTNPGE